MKVLRFLMRYINPGTMATIIVVFFRVLTLVLGWLVGRFFYIRFGLFTGLLCGVVFVLCENRIVEDFFFYVYRVICGGIDSFDEDDL